MKKKLPDTTQDKILKMIIILSTGNKIKNILFVIDTSKMSNDNVDTMYMLRLIRELA